MITQTIIKQTLCARVCVCVPFATAYTIVDSYVYILENWIRPALLPVQYFHSFHFLTRVNIVYRLFCRMMYNNNTNNYWPLGLVKHRFPNTKIHARCILYYVRRLITHALADLSSRNTDTVCLCMPSILTRTIILRTYLYRITSTVKRF